MWWEIQKRATIKNSINPLSGLFELITDPVWEDRYDSHDMTFEFLIRYGERLAAPYITHFKTKGQEDKPLTSEEIAYIMRILSNKYREAWSRKYAILSASYEVLDNYRMVEEEEIDRGTLDVKIAEILSTNVESRKQIAELIEIAKRDETFTNTKKGKDSTEGSLKTDGNVHTIAKDSDKNKAKTTDTLNFVNRVDTETRDLTAITDGRKIDTVKDKEVLSFEDRVNQTTYEYDKIIDDTETNDSEVIDDNKVEGDNKESLFGYNIGEAKPTSSTDGMTKTDNKTTSEIVIERDNRVEEDSTNTEEKRGRELTERDNGLRVKTDDTVRDTGTLTNGKTGKEININEIDGTLTKEIDNKVTTDLEDVNKNVITYDTEDVARNLGENGTTNNSKTKDISVAKDKENESSTLTGTVEEKRKFKRSGNIGVTTTTQLMQDHINFWSFNFLDSVYEDIASELTLSVYEGGQI